MIKNIEKSFSFSQKDIEKTIKNFHSEMSKGLAGHKSSLAMIPTYALMPKGNETGRFIALDLGGTNFRVLEVLLEGKGRMRVTAENKFRLEKKDITGTGAHLFNFIADSIKRFMLINKVSLNRRENLGFTFSFPVKQTSLISGILPFWNKGFSASDVVGKDVVILLNKALERKKVNNIKITALLNDTAGTLAAGAYSDMSCDAGIIFGTGTNACYKEKMSNIKKWHGPSTSAEHMIINMEWGNFNKIARTVYDENLDRNSLNPGRQRLEKMVSGLYLGEIARLIFLDLIKKKLLFKNISPSAFKKNGSFKTEYISIIEGDNSRRLNNVEKLLMELGIPDSTYKDRMLIKRICRIVLIRSARISTAAMSAVMLWMDPKIMRRHTIAIDGSLFSKCSNYRKYVESALDEIFKEKKYKIKLVLTKDGSGKGAAVVAATAS